jgi:hypothetical protein
MQQENSKTKTTNWLAYIEGRNIKRKVRKVDISAATDSEGEGGGEPTRRQQNTWASVNIYHLRLVHK